MKKFPWFLSFELGARQACDRRHRTMGTVHSGKISHLTWTFTKKYWAVLGCTGLYWAVLGHLRYLLGNVQVKWRILPLCSGVRLQDPGCCCQCWCWCLQQPARRTGTEVQLTQPPAAVYMFANTELTISSVPILASMFPEMVHTGNGTPI